MCFRFTNLPLFAVLGLACRGFGSLEYCDRLLKRDARSRTQTVHNKKSVQNDCTPSHVLEHCNSECLIGNTQAQKGP